MPVNRNSKVWWLLVPVVLVLSVGTAVWVRTGLPRPVNIDFSKLTDTRGQVGDSAAFAGRYLIVSFGYTSCPDVCPLTLAALHSALESLGSDSSSLIPVFITVDPERDTPQRLATYVSSFDPRIRGFTGSPEAIKSVAAAVRVDFQKQPVGDSSTYTVDHTALLFLVDPERRVIAEIPENLPARDLSQQIVRDFKEVRGAR